MTPVGNDPPIPGRRTSPIAWIALALGVLALTLVAIGGPGTRFGWWHFGTAFRTLWPWGVRLGIAAVVLGLIAAVLAARRPGRRGLVTGIVAVALGALAFFVPWNFRRTARGVPPIHDITTDFTNPPPITYSRAMRDTTEGMNGWEYEGDSIAQQQRRAYPDIRPVMLALPPDSAWGVVYQTAREMGWEITNVQRDQGIVEAADMTPWFGFVDDVVIRVTPASGITRVDIRSKSRVGRSDVGANAARIRRYVEALEKKGAVASPE